MSEQVLAGDLSGRRIGDGGFLRPDAEKWCDNMAVYVRGLCKAAGLAVPELADAFGVIGAETADSLAEYKRLLSQRWDWLRASPVDPRKRIGSVLPPPGTNRTAVPLSTARYLGRPMDDRRGEDGRVYPEDGPDYNPQQGGYMPGGEDNTRFRSDDETR